MAIKRILSSFVYAFRGMRAVARSEKNFMLHIIAMAIVITCGILYKVSPLEWIAVTICIGTVLSAEIFNTVIERLADVISPGEDRRIGAIKDMSAAAVLVSAIASAIVGLIIFIPKIFHI